jgi:hypothetical protein
MAYGDSSRGDTEANYAPIPVELEKNHE